MIDMAKTWFLRYAPPALLQMFKKWHYVRVLRNFGDDEEKDIIVAKKLVHEGETAIDIGANVGIYTKVLAERVGVHGRVYGIEPVPPTFSLLTHCIKALGLSNVKLLNIGISDSNTTVSMTVPSYASGGENFYMAHIVAGACDETGENVFNVKVQTLDSLFSDVNEKISFIKCDVEGHEWPVLCGARNVIEKFRPAWLIEISGDPENPSSDSHKVFAYLTELGYTAYWFDGVGLKKRVPGEKSVNYFFLTPGHLQRVQSANIPVIQN
jgi:FkbM family methyltransferase